MKKIIANVEYDTEKAELIHKITRGFIGDPAGYEEALYKTPDGKFFLYGNGGEESAHKKEDITRMSKQRADAWLAENK